MEAYEKLLDKAYKEVKVVGGTGERFEIPKVAGQVSGNSTFITNIKQIADYLRRPVEHIAKFLFKELAVFGRVEGSRLVLKTKLNSSRVNEKVEKYAKEFVMCPVCGKPDTEVVSEKGVKNKHCLACGANSPIKYHL
ncbi:MAG: translation initiation factor IF-2 subunit beta [Nanoarchaeota archaeon]|nr:translation initiation factor IF-2 subunit beta [Nanoarchaeota archaeon]